MKNDLWIAVLGAGPSAVVSHESVALVHGAEKLPTRPVTLTVPHGGHHRLPGVLVHQIDDLAPSHRANWQGLTVSSPPRAVVELGATRSLSVVGRVADDLVRARRTTYSAIAAVLAAVTRPGKPGLGTVAAVLSERSDGHVPASSVLEEALFAALSAGGLPDPVRQVPLPGRGPLRGLVDAAYPDALIVIEADGRRWHSRVDAARRDRERDAQVVRAGWVPLRFVYEQVLEDPAAVCAVVAETLGRRITQLAGAA